MAHDPGKSNLMGLHVVPHDEQTPGRMGEVLARSREYVNGDFDLVAIAVPVGYGQDYAAYIVNFMGATRDPFSNAEPDA